MFLRDDRQPGRQRRRPRSCRRVAHAAGVPFIADNTVATPLMLKPIHHGADVVVHSLTKFVGGHGTTLGGAIVDGGTFPWAEHADRFPGFNEPEPAFHDVVFARDFPDRPFVDTGPLDPTAQHRRHPVALQLVPAAPGTRDPGRPPRAPRGQCAGDRRLPGRRSARRLGELRRASRTIPYHTWCSATSRRVPSIITFGVAGGYEAGLAFFDSLQLFKRLLNLGDAKSLAIHPASTTHRQLTPSRADRGRHPTRDDPALHRARACGRSDRRPRPGSGGGDRLKSG